MLMLTALKLGQCADVDSIKIRKYADVDSIKIRTIC